MDPLDEMPSTRPAPSLPFALKVFIVFASSVCAGAGFGLTLWALPTVAPQHIVQTVVHDTQKALDTVLSTEPCSPDTQATNPCHPTEDLEGDASAGGVVPVAGREENADTAITDEGRILLQTNKILQIEQAPQKTEDKKQVQQKPKEVKTPPPVKKPVAQPAPQQPVQQKTPPTVEPISTFSIQPLIAPAPISSVPQCIRNTSYLPASTLPLNPNGPAFQLTVDEPNYYTVFGRTALEIRRQMAQCTPIQGGFDAVTHWWYRYSYSYYEKDTGLCGIKDVTLVLHITFLFPHWKSDTDNLQLTAQWNQYFTNLETHEFGHRDITIQYAQNALAAIQAFPDASCTNIVQTVNAYADAQLDIIQQRNTSYDAQTGHGSTQGAVFP